MKKTKVDEVVKEYLNLRDRDVDEMKYYFIGGKIDSVKIKGDSWGASLGDPAITARFYQKGVEVFEACQKERATSFGLRVNGCADPRVVATHILAARLRALGYRAGLNSELMDEEINAALNPLPTIKSAERWLERNLFVGPQALKKQAIVSNDFQIRDDAKRRFPECWPEDNCPGWDIYELRRELAYVQPQARPLYLRYLALWKKAEREWLRH
ncbi:MAG: hypothetical protein IJM30_08495 [Thermoguttaceae bacterium]|nr:hypothetical protein [Thermoguttaceae bacterium]